LSRLLFVCGFPSGKVFTNCFFVGLQQAQLKLRFDLRLPDHPLEATIRYVPPEATDVSFFCSHESTVDTPGVFGVSSASSLVVGDPASGQPTFLISGVCVSLPCKR